MAGLHYTRLRISLLGEGLVQLLIDRGANIEEITGVEVGATPLHLAACRDQFDPNVVLALLNAGADIDALDENGRTPEERAINHGRTQGVEVLQNWTKNSLGSPGKKEKL